MVNPAYGSSVEVGLGWGEGVGVQVSVGRAVGDGGAVCVSVAGMEMSLGRAVADRSAVGNSVGLSWQAATNIAMASNTHRVHDTRVGNLLKYKR
jgi:hypothetical protein